jgi:4-hydroxy-tetrahydrodipicolinate synthase
MQNWGRVLTAMVTPFDQDGNIDVDGVNRVVEHLLAHGSDALVVCGTTGESPTLSNEEKIEMFRLVKAAVGGRGGVIAGVGSNDTAHSIHLAKEAEALGVDGLLTVAPYYNRPSQEGMYLHFRAIANAVSTPVMLYNVPPRTSSNIDASTVLRLARDIENIVAVKEASGNLVQVSEIVAGAPHGFRVYSGEDALTLPLLSIGGYGVVSVSSHLVGKDMQAMHCAYLQGNTAEAARIHLKMLPVVRALFQPTTPSPAPLKAAMEMIGVPSGGLRLPLSPCNEAERAIVSRALTEYGILG